MSANDDNGRMAMIMVALACLAMLGALSLAFDQMLDRRQNPNRSVTAEAVNGDLEITLKSDERGHYRVDGEINGHPVTFLVDTGATSISIPGQLAETMGLEAGIAIPTRTAAGQVTSYATRLESVDIGGIRRENISATINPAMDMDEVLLGMNFLGPLELSHRQGELRIRAPGEAEH